MQPTPPTKATQKPSSDQLSQPQEEQLPLDEPVPTAPVTATAQPAIEEGTVHSTAEVPTQPVEQAAPLPTASAQKLSAEPAKPQVEHKGSSNTTLPKPAITFFYRVQPSPTRPPTLWCPEGRFQDKTLGDLLRELPFKGDVGGLDFTISGSDILVMERIMRDDEDRFESMKRHVELSIRKWLSRQRQLGGGENKVPRLMMNILIEPTSDNHIQQPLEELEEVEMNW